MGKQNSIQRQLSLLAVGEISVQPGPMHPFFPNQFVQVSYEFSLRHSIVEVDRDAERRWSMMIEKKRAAEAKGEEFSDSANIEERRWATGRKGPRLIKIY